MAIRARNRATSDIDQKNQTKLPEIRRSALSLAIALALPGAMMMSGVALAQDDLDEEGGEQTEELVMEEVVVTGKFRASLIDAIATKRSSTSIIEAISA